MTPTPESKASSRAPKSPSPEPKTPSISPESSLQAAKSPSLAPMSPSLATKDIHFQHSYDGDVDDEVSWSRSPSPDPTIEPRIYQSSAEVTSPAVLDDVWAPTTASQDVDRYPFVDAEGGKRKTSPVDTDADVDLGCMVDGHQDKRSEIPEGDDDQPIFRLLRLIEEWLTQRVRGQPTAVSVVSGTLYISLACPFPCRPLASFLFVGPKAVGKQTCSQAIATYLSPDGTRAFVKLDMSLYGTADARSLLSKRLAGLFGYDDDGETSSTATVCRWPPAVIVFDNIEKAHSVVIDMILGSLTTGVLFDEEGRLLSFKNTVICLHSCLGCDAMYDQGATEFDGRAKVEVVDTILDNLAGKITKELCFRVDDIVVFQTLKPDILSGIVDRLFEPIADRLETRDITLVVTRDAQELIASTCFYEDAGAALVDETVRRLDEHIEEELIRGAIRDGQGVALITEGTSFLLAPMIDVVRGLEEDEWY